MKQVLAFDFGASNGRAILGGFDGKKITLTEVHRFANEPVTVHGSFYWDVLRLLHEIKQGIVAAKQLGGFDSLAIDTWGVDFGLLDADGRLLENPVHYRDTRTAGIIERCEKTMSKEALYAETGIASMEFNTLYQLAALKETRPQLLERAQTLLFMPNLLAYMLTGQKTTEFSIASTSQLMGIGTADWSQRLIDAFGLPKRILTPILPSGTVIGTLTPELCGELSCPAATVIAACGHDTACAVAAVPTDSKDILYLSSGTWSLMGTELAAPVVTDIALTNEGGYGNTIRYLRTIAGLWLIQESRREWARQGQEYSYAQLEQLAVESGPARCFIDPDAPEFTPSGNLPRRIAEYCGRTGQYIPQTIGEIIRCVYESLGRKYAEVKAQLEQATGKRYPALHIIGGGIKDTFLCQMAADYCECPVFAGPAEATALGNIAVQLIASGDIADITEARKIIAASVELKQYLPRAAVRG